MLRGKCHCGAVNWTFDGDPGSETACNCTVDRRYAALWAYDFLDERIRIEGPVSSYARTDIAKPHLEWLFCPTCGCVVAWRGLSADNDGRTRAAVNVRLADPEAVARLAVDRFDGLDTFEDLPSDGRCVHDMWF